MSHLQNVYVSMHAYPTLCLSGFLPVLLPACLSRCLPVLLTPCPPPCLSRCLTVPLPSYHYLPVLFPASPATCLSHCPIFYFYLYRYLLSRCLPVLLPDCPTAPLYFLP